MKTVSLFLAVMLVSALGFSQSGGRSLTDKLAATAAVVNNSVTLVSDVVINPNPVKGERFSLQLQNLEKGKYNVYIHNKEGRKFLLKTITYEGGSSIADLDLPEELGAGTYILQVLSKTARFSKKMVVE